MLRIKILLLLVLITAAIPTGSGAQRLEAPPKGKFYQGLYFDDPKKDRDPTEHDITPVNVMGWEESLQTKVTWVYFSNNWSESRRFPSEICDWIRGLGKVPYIRLMLRSDLEQNRAEKVFTLTNNITYNWTYSWNKRS